MDLLFTEKNPKLFYSLRDFPALQILEDNFAVILNELQALKSGAANGDWLNTFPD